MEQVKHSLFTVLALVLLVGCSQKPQSDVDTPAYHYSAGMRAIDNGEYQDALQSFQRSIQLDRKFLPGYAGLALAQAHLGQTKDAKRNLDWAVSRGGKDPDILAVGALVWIALRDSEKGWFKQAEKLVNKALKKHPKHEGALYACGLANLYQYNFDKAESCFKKVVDLKGEYAGKADAKWQMTQKIVRAMPGTPVGRKVALHEQITRADLAVLFIEELKVGELFERMSAPSAGFQTPAEMQAQRSSNLPPDATGHWAENWIKEVLRYNVMDIFPDGKFYPDETVTRANYAMAVQRLLVAATRDPSLETRYFGESPSRFSDVPSSHPAYNAMALCTERGIMQADVMTGRFNPNGPVSGADALLIIRTLQNSLRMTF
jgi:tetratricopeptide (TPR) repeat protein